MMRSPMSHQFVIGIFSRNGLIPQRSSHVFYSLKYYHPVCAVSKCQSTFNRNVLKCLDKRLLASNLSLFHRPSSGGCLTLQKQTSNFRCINELQPCKLNNSYNPISRDVILLKYHFSTSNDKEEYRPGVQGPCQDEPKKLTIVQRFKAMLKDYWHVLVPVHVITSIGWFGGFYYLATSGMDIPALMESVNFSEQFVKPFRDSSMGYIAVAYGLYKIATPVRYTVTVGGTSIAIKILKERGLVQPWPINLGWLTNAPKKRRPKPS